MLLTYLTFRIMELDRSIEVNLPAPLVLEDSIERDPAGFEQNGVSNQGKHPEPPEVLGTP